MINNLRLHLSNLPGKRVKKKIIVFESDDWGSVYVHDKRSFDFLKNFGLSIDENHYGFDSLESNDDLEILFNLLLEFKDATGRNPVFTAFCNMANPDFEKIIENKFSNYFYESIDKTINKYSNHNKLLQFWNEGKKNRIFVPQLHGREHIHIGRWWSLVQMRDAGIIKAIQYNSIGARSFRGRFYINFFNALHPDHKKEIPYLHKILEDAGNLYFRYLGQNPEAFVAPNSEEPAELEKTLKKLGINTLTRSKIRKYPLGDDKYKIEFNWPGRVNGLGQVILVRNAFFEPVCYGEPGKAHINDWVDHCLKQINIAFNWKKPAVISTHRVNYIGSINPKNRNKGINELRRLLREIIKHWPDVEFITTPELGKQIIKN